MTRKTADPRPRAVRTLAPQGAPPGIYASKYDLKLGLEICVRVAAGESLRSMCRGDPSMPTEKTVWNWARAHPEFAAWWDWARTTVRARLQAERTAKVEARAAEVARAARVAARVEGAGMFTGGPGSRGLPAWNRGRSGYGPEIAGAICDRLCLGETLPSVCRDPDMPCVATVYNWLRDEPEFLEAYRRAKETAFHYIVETAAQRAPWAGTEAKSMRDLARIVKRAHGRCGKLAPKGLADGAYGPED